MTTKKEDIKTALEILKSLKQTELEGFEREIAEDLIKRKIEVEYRYFKACGWTIEQISEELNKYYLNEESIKGWLKEFSEIKKAILEKRLVLSWKGGFWWGVGIIKDNEIREISLTNMEMLCSYHLDYEKRAYKMSVYGTNRALEIILQYGYSLGLKFSEIPQNQQIIY